LLNKLGYPKLKEQKKLHKDFIEHVKDIELDYNNGVTDSCGRLNKILTEKCINYFNANNQEIYSFLKEKGNI
jgi:hemerythrin